MSTNPLVALTPAEITQCFALHATYCRENPKAPDWQQHWDRAQEFAQMLPDCPLEEQVQLYEVRE